MKLVIIDYGAGNVESVVNACKNVLPDAAEIIISNKSSDLQSASHLILPGVGAFADCMNGLKSKPDLLQELERQVLQKQKPFLGICVGMQVLAATGYENGKHDGLGWIDGIVEKITAQNLKIPHMGWNDLLIKSNSHPIVKSIATGSHFYFANSYHFLCEDENVIAQVEYGSKLNVIIVKRNIVGVQFHPEKSGEVGLKLLSNFFHWQP